jgi:hypothetical protein
MARPKVAFLSGTERASSRLLYPASTLSLVLGCGDPF